MSYFSSGSSPSGATFSTGPSSSTSRSPSAEPSSSKHRRLTLQDIHIPAGFEIAKGLDQPGSDYPSEENIQRAAEVLQSLRGRMPDGSDGQVAACDYCRRRKIRCDRIKPTCGSCTSSGRKCTTEDMLRKRGPPSKKERAILEAAGIIFRGTRPHRRRRTATTSLGSGAANKQQEEILRKAKEVAGTRTRANSTNSGETAATAAMVADAFGQLSGGSKSSWMEMLSVATQSTNPFADSPASSPSDISGQDTFHIDAGACDYILPGANAVGAAPMEVRSVSGGVPAPNRGAQWDSMWAAFGAELRTKHTVNPSLELPNLSAFACNAVDTKDGLFRSPLASFDAGALDWSASNISPSQYQMLFPNSTPQMPPTMQVGHVDPQMMTPLTQDGAPFITSQTSMAAEALAFESAMGHFFPKPEDLSSSLSTSSSATAEATTPTELDQFISITDPHQHQNHHQQHHQQHHIEFNIDSLSAF